MPEPKTGADMSKDAEADRKAVFLAWLNSHLGTGKGTKSGKELAARLGLTPPQITRLRKGERPLKVSELRIIEDYIGEPAPGYGTSVAVDGPTISMPVSVVIAPGVWREAGAAVMSTERAYKLLDKSLDDVEQYACAVESDPNRTAICAPYSKLRVTPKAGDLVHVVRVRGNLEEHTLWTVDGNATDGYWLVSEQVAPVRHKIPFPRNGQTRETQVRGLVIAEQFKRKF